MPENTQTVEHEDTIILTDAETKLKVLEAELGGIRTSIEGKYHHSDTLDSLYNLENRLIELRDHLISIASNEADQLQTVAERLEEIVPEVPPEIKPLKHKTNGTQYDFHDVEMTDISDEAVRIYHYWTEHGDREIDIETPLWVGTTWDGFECVVAKDGYSIILPPGWSYIEIHPFAEARAAE